jgi:uncharacterized Zn finger protein
MAILYVDLIKCPQCGALEAAIVKHAPGAPWPDFTHICNQCGYCTLESEWETVNPTPQPPQGERHVQALA